MKKTLKLVLPLLAIALLLGGCTISGTISIGGDGMVYGRVTDPVGNGIEDAYVELIRISDDTTIADDVTNSAGFYQIDNIPNGQYLLAVRKSNYETHMEEITVLGDENIDVELSWDW